MAFLDFLDHSCDIYHVIVEDISLGYGIEGIKKRRYPSEADATYKCHFAQSGSSGTVNTYHSDPPHTLNEDRIKVVFPLEADIRANDKVIDHRTGFVYYMEIPRTIRNHHKYAFVKREGNEAAL